MSITSNSLYSPSRSSSTIFENTSFYKSLQPRTKNFWFSWKNCVEVRLNATGDKNAEPKVVKVEKGFAAAEANALVDADPA
jgi:hypothetical protein